MAQDTSLEGLRAQYLTSLFGRRLTLDQNEFLLGPKDIRTAVMGLSSVGSTYTSSAGTSAGATGGATAGTTATGLYLRPFGLSLIGTSLTSGSTGQGSTSPVYILDNPVPGVRKAIINYSTADASVYAGANAAFLSTKGNTSTYGYINLHGIGVGVDLIGISTWQWGILTPITTASTNIAVI